MSQMNIQLKGNSRHGGAALSRVGRRLRPLTSLWSTGVTYFKRRGELLFSPRAKGPEAMSRMNWRGFELLIGQVFRSQGFKVMDVCSGRPDEGIDVMLLRGAEKFLVQCKYWNASVVDKDKVRELHQTVVERGATGGYMVTSGTYAQDARAYAQGHGIILVDGAKLESMLQQVREDSVSHGSQRA